MSAGGHARRVTATVWRIAAAARCAICRMASMFYTKARAASAV
jgi:hypothetical protein